MAWALCVAPRRVAFWRSVNVALAEIRDLKLYYLKELKEWTGEFTMNISHSTTIKNKEKAVSFLRGRLGFALFITLGDEEREREMVVDADGDDGDGLKRCGQIDR
jgi:hypothetical protein